MTAATIRMKARGLLGRNGAAALVLSVVLILVLSAGSRIFWSTENLNSLQTSIAPAAIVSFGMCLLLVCGVFDLSVGSIMVFSGVLCAELFSTGLPVPAVILLSLCAGAGLGLINGVLVAVLGINPLIATIGTMGSIQGVALLMYAGSQLGQAEYTVRIDLPQSFIRLGTEKLFGLHYMFWIAVILLILIALFQRYSPLGRKMYLIGDNREAASLMGFGTVRIILSTFVFTGFLCAAAGLLSVARLGQASRYLGEGINLMAIISCILGGASFVGGRGSALGTFGGVCCMVLITNMFNLFEVKASWQGITVGAILMAVVAADGAMLIRKQRDLGKL